MFCNKCGTDNGTKAKFCGACGNKLKDNNKDTKNIINNYKKRLNNIPKKTKIMGIVSLIIIIALIILCILLNNPLKKVEDKLGDYYENYSKDGNKELIEIGKILKSNKDNEKLLKNIKKNTQKEVEKWTKNFNKDYKSKEELNKSYQKLTDALKEIYDYYNGLEYMLDYDLYSKLTKEAEDLYYSKTHYLTALKYEEEKDEYYAYYYYQKVSDLDNYYKTAQKYINNYVKEEITAFKENVEKIINITDESTNKEILESYIAQIKYVNENKITNNIDLSSSEEYQKLHKNAIQKIKEYTKKVVAELESNLEYKKAIETIEASINNLDNKSAEYKELNDLKENIKTKLPDNLLTKYLVSSTWASGSSTYTKEINGTEYDSNLSFAFEGDTQSRVYRLNGVYKRFKAIIERGENWDKTFNGYFVIKGDDKELYKSDTITKNSDLKKEIDIDVTGIDDLKIEFVTKSDSETLDSFYIYLVEPYLYK